MKSTNMSSATGAHAGRCRADRGAHERRFGDGCIKYPPRELVVEPFRHAEHTAPGVLLAWRSCAARVVLAHDDDALVAFHFLGQRLVERLAVGDGPCHGQPPISSACKRR